MSEETKTNETDNQAKAKNPKILIAAVAVIILALAVGNYNAPAKRLARQLDLGQKYLAELDYEQAVVAFNKVIEIDPKNVGAYLGLAEAYDGMGDLEKVSEVLEKGFELTRSDEIKGMLETYISETLAAAVVNDIEAETFPEPVESENISTSAEEETEMTEAVTTVEETSTETTTVEEIKTGFVMLDGELYYYDAAGQLVIGWFDANGNRYCARGDGRLYRDGEYEIDGRKCAFGQDGIFLGIIEDDAWKQAYIDYIVRQRDLYSAERFGEVGFALIYLDDDNIPELACGGSDIAMGLWLVNYSNNTVQETYIGMYGFYYMLFHNLLYVPTGNQGHYRDIVYSIINGKMTAIAEGKYGIGNDADPYQFDESDYIYEWEGQIMTKDEYYAELKKVYNTDAATLEFTGGYKHGGYNYNYGQIIDVIKNW